MGVTARLAEFARGLSFDAIPDDAVACAKHCFLDVLGVALAGAEEPAAQIVRAESGGDGATLIGSRQRATPYFAALVNGTAAHALDFDDTHMAMSGHPTVPVAPAALALAESLGASGEDLITAFVGGVEVECRVGALVAPGHYATGFHATGTVGTFGAAAACARLLGLDQGRWLHALGLAGAQAAGLKSMFGTMTKPLHAGKAAANGLLAARLAANGFTANQEVLDAAQGFTATQTTTASPERALRGLGDRLAVRDVLFKYHAACYLTHSGIEAALRLNVAPDDVASIVLRVPPGHLSVCNIAEPATGLEGKFSLRFTAALAIGGRDTADPATYTDEAVRDAGLVSLRDKVTVVPAPGLGQAETEVVITTRDGAVRTGSASTDRAAEDLDLQWTKLVAKFVGLAAPVLGRDRAEEIVGVVSKLDQLDTAATLLALCVP